MNDIVARIREQANAGYIDEHEVMLREAADYIEMLRRLLQEQIAATRHMINAHEKRETELLLQLEQA